MPRVALVFAFILCAACGTPGRQAPSAAVVAAAEVMVPDSVPLIRPDVYLATPNPFPIDTSTDRNLVRAQNLAPRNWTMKHARPCNPVALADTTGWQPIDRSGTLKAVTYYPGSWRQIAIKLPPAFARDTGFRSYHGGYSWANGQSYFRIESGYWSPRPTVPVVRHCRVETRAGPYIVEQEHRGGLHVFTAQPLDSVWRPSLGIQGAAPTRESLRIPWTAFVLMSPP
jgi:hypothetical protein